MSLYCTLSKSSCCIQNLSPSKKRKKEARTERPMEQTRISFLLPPLSFSLSYFSLVKLPHPRLSAHAFIAHIMIKRRSDSET